MQAVNNSSTLTKYTYMKDSPMPADARPTDALAAMRLPEFRLLIIGRLIAQLGEMMVSVAIGWELYQRTQDPLALGLVGLVQVIPVFLLGLPGGYVADHYDRKKLTMYSQAALVICSLLLMYLSQTQGDLLVIYIVLALIGAARAFNNPAEGALTPQFVPPHLYQNAATWNSTTWQTAAIAGPAVGGLIIGIANSASAVYLINAVAGLVLIGVLLIVKGRPQEYPDTTETPLQSVKAGWRFVRSKQLILGSITLDMFAVLLGGATFLLPIFAEEILKVDALGLGLLRAAPSIGAVLMAVVIANMPPFKRAGITLLWSVVGFGVATIVFGISTDFWLSMVMLAILGALDNISVVIRHVLVMTYTPDEMLGRVSSVNSIFIGASNELGGFESGVAAALLGPVWAVVAGGIGTILVVLGVAYWAPQLRQLGEIRHHEEPSKPAAQGAD
jgi:MFS family permease